MNNPHCATPDAPRWYALLWSTVTGVILVCGTLAAPLSYGAWRVATAIGFVVAIVGGCGLIWSFALGFSWRKAVGAGFGSGCFLIASWGLVAVFGPGSLAVPAVTAALAPSSIRLAPRGFASRNEAGDGQPDRARPPSADVWQGAALLVADDDLRRMTFQDLCRFWRYSQVELDTVPIAPRALQLVRQPAICLDEMELRQPSAFAHWMTTGAPTTDPRSFLKPSGQPPYDEAN